MSFCIIIKSVRDNDCHDSVMHLPNCSAMTCGYIIPLPGVCRCTLSKSYICIIVIDLEQCLGTPWLHSLAFKVSLLQCIWREIPWMFYKLLINSYFVCWFLVSPTNYSHEKCCSMDTNVYQPWSIFTLFQQIDAGITPQVRTLQLCVW